MRMEESLRGPRVAVISTRVIAYRADPLCPVLREGLSGLGSIVGGKVPQLPAHPGERMSGELLATRITQELLEETTLAATGKLRPVTTLYCPQRYIEYPRVKFVELGYDMSGIPDEQEIVRVWNPTVYVFATRVDGEVPSEPVEGRAVFEVPLLEPSWKKRVKARHRPILRAWKKQITHGKAIPPIIEIYDEEDMPNGTTSDSGDAVE